MIWNNIAFLAQTKTELCNFKRGGRMRKRISLFVFVGVVSLSILILCFSVQFIDIHNLPESLPLTFEDIENINNEKPFGKGISASLGEESVNVGGEKFSIKKLVFKLFGFIPIKSIEANLVETKEVYLGGVPVGLTIDVDGLVVLGSNCISTENGNIDPFENSKLKVGDIITSINGKKVTNLKELESIVGNEYDGEELKLEIIRKGETINLNLTPALDKESGTYKIGLWVRNDAAGVGTLTFVDCDTLKFGALGHAITDYETGAIVPAKSGKLFPCSIVGVNKGEKGEPGEIKGIFMQGKNCKGTIEKNCQFGVFGQISDKTKIVDANKTADVASRLTVKPGKAKIISNVSGVSEEYEIEIIKANYQPSESDKSFVFRVVDKRLLELTGGIIQGMSGSPIMQNDKLIGAVTHVFVSDPTKGYGVYIDWMIAAA